MKKCPGTFLNPECGNEIKKPQSRLCDECMKDVDYVQNVTAKHEEESRAMEASLSKSFVGATVNIEKMLATDWHDQESANYFFGLPRQKGLWAKQLEHKHFSDQGGKVFYALLQLTKSCTIKIVKTEFYQIYPDGSVCQLAESLTETDYDVVRTACNDILD